MIKLRNYLKLMSATYLLIFLPLYLGGLLFDVNSAIDEGIYILFRTSFLFPIAWSIMLVPTRGQDVSEWTPLAKIFFAASGACLWVPDALIAIGVALSPANSGF